MLIGAFSKYVKTTVKTLRYYDRIGLFCPADTDPVTGYRNYTVEQLADFGEIRQLRAAGVSVEQIKRIFDGGNREAILREHSLELAKQEDLLRKQKENVALLLNTPINNNYVVNIKKLPPYTVCTCRDNVKDIAHIPPAFSKRFKEMTQTYTDLSLSQPNYCYVTFVDTSHKDTDIEVEYAEAVTKALENKSSFVFKTLTDCTIACVEHRGAYENIPNAYAALFKWLASSGYQMAGTVRERFIHGAWNGRSEADWLIEIQVPIKGLGE